MRTAVSLLAILLLAVPLAARAQIYKWVDENGVVHYTSTPPPSDKDAEQVTDASESSDDTEDDTEEDGAEPSAEDDPDGDEDEQSGSDRSTMCERAVGEIPSAVDTYLEGARKNLKDGHVTREQYDELKSRMRTLEAHLTVPDCMRAEGRYLEFYECLSESYGDFMFACRSLIPED